MSDSIKKRPFMFGNIKYVAVREFESTGFKFQPGDSVDKLPRLTIRRLYRFIGRKDDPWTKVALEGKVQTLDNGLLSAFVKKDMVKSIVQKVKDIVTQKVTAKSKKSDLVKYAEQNGIVVDPEATNKEIYEQIQKGVK